MSGECRQPALPQPDIDTSHFDVFLPPPDDFPSFYEGHYYATDCVGLVGTGLYLDDKLAALVAQGLHTELDTPIPIDASLQREARQRGRRGSAESVTDTRGQDRGRTRSRSVGPTLNRNNKGRQSGRVKNKTKKKKKKKRAGLFSCTAPRSRSCTPERNSRFAVAHHPPYADLPASALAALITRAQQDLARTEQLDMEGARIGEGIYSKQVHTAQSGQSYPYTLQTTCEGPPVWVQRTTPRKQPPPPRERPTQPPPPQQQQPPAHTQTRTPHITSTMESGYGTYRHVQGKVHVEDVTCDKKVKEPAEKTSTNWSFSKLSLRNLSFRRSKRNKNKDDSKKGKDDEVEVRRQNEYIDVKRSRSFSMPSKSKEQKQELLRQVHKRYMPKESSDITEDPYTIRSSSSGSSVCSSCEGPIGVSHGHRATSQLARSVSFVLEKNNNNAPSQHQEQEKGSIYSTSISSNYSSSTDPPPPPPHVRASSRAAASASRDYVNVPVESPPPLPVRNKGMKKEGLYSTTSSRSSSVTSASSQASSHTPKDKYVPPPVQTAPLRRHPTVTSRPCQTGDPTLRSVDLVKTLDLENIMKKKSWICGMAVTRKNEIVVVDQSEAYVLDEEGNLKKTIGSKTSVKLGEPLDVAVMANGNLVFSDHSGEQDVKVYNWRGQFLRRLKDPGLNNIAGVAITAQREVVVAGTDKQRLSVLSEDDELVRTIPPMSENGSKPTKSPFEHPYSVAVNPLNGDIIVGDDAKQLVTAVSKDDGRVLWRFSPAGGRERHFFPSSICVDPNGYIFIADLYNDKVYMLDSSGKFLKTVLSRGSGLKGGPGAVAVDGRGHLLVADEDRAVKIFRYGDDKGFALNKRESYCPEAH